MTVLVVVDPVGDSAESGEAGLVGDDVLNGVGAARGRRCGLVGCALLARKCRREAMWYNTFI